MSIIEAADTLVKEIVIKAPAERIFQALADPVQRVKWWGVAGRFQAEHMKSDLRVGGAWEMTGTAMGDRPFIVKGVYRVVERLRVLEMTWLADWHPNAEETIVRFEMIEKGGETTVRLTHSGLAEEAKKNYQGWPWLLSLLQKYVEGGEGA